MGEDSWSSTVAGALIGALATLTVGGAVAWSDREKLQQESQRLKQELEVAEADRKVAQDELALQKRQFDAGQVAVFGPELARLEAARSAFEAPDGTPESRLAALKRLAASIREASRRPPTPQDFTTPLPPYVHETVDGLTSMLKQELHKVDLSRVDLHGHYWGDAVLDRILLRAADLRAVDLTDASLQSTYLDEALLQCADFSNANMDLTQLGGADLRWSDLRGVDLSGVEGLTNTRLTGVAYDETTQWPDSVNQEELGEPATYSEPRLCAEEHLTAGADTAQPSVEPGPSPST